MLETQAPKFMTVNEVARELRLHPVTVYRKIKDGELDAERLAGGSRLRVRAEAVERLLTPNTQERNSKDGQLT